MDVQRRRLSPCAWAAARTALATLASAFFAMTATAGAAPPNVDVPGGYASTHILIRTKPGVAPKKLADGRFALVRPANSGAPASAESARLLGNANASRSVRVFATASDKALAAQLGMDRTYRIDVANGTDTMALARNLNALKSLVELAEVDGIGGVAGVPNDAEFFAQYDMNNTGQTIGGVAGIVDADVDAPEAFDVVASLGLDTSTVTVALLDAGVNPHVELAGRILPGVNIPDGTTITTDECSSHGTHVTGIMAATGNNGIGIAGLAWNLKIKPYVVLNGCNGFESDVATGLTLATDEGIRLVNMSLQFGTGTATFHNAVLYAAAHDVVMVAAAGNNGSSVVSYPAKWAETIAVSATNNIDQKWVSSNFGPEIDLAAPGQTIHSLIGTNSYGDKSGTSMAAPHVTGTVALMFARNPTLTTAQVRSILQATAVDIDAPGFDNNTGWGRVNANAALLATPDPNPSDLDHDGTVGPADLAILLGAWGTCADCDGGCPADLDGDCTVGPADLAILLGAWG